LLNFINNLKIQSSSDKTKIRDRIFGISEKRSKAKIKGLAKGLLCLILRLLGRFPAGRALRCNLFARASQKGFALQSLTQNPFSI